MKSLELKRMQMMSKLKKHTENLLSNGILIKILKILNKLNKSLEKYHKLMKYFLIKTKEKLTINMVIKGLDLNLLQDLEDIHSISTMLKIFLGTFSNKTLLKMIFSVDSLEEIRIKRVLLQKLEVEDSVHSMMILSFLVVLEEGLEDLGWDCLEHNLCLKMMIFSQTRRKTFQ